MTDFFNEIRDITKNTIITLTDGNLYYMDTNLDDVLLDWYKENGIIDTIEFRFDNGIRVTFTTDGTERTEMMTFFAQNFAELTVAQFLDKFKEFLEEEMNNVVEFDLKRLGIDFFEV